MNRLQELQPSASIYLTPVSILRCSQGRGLSLIQEVSVFVARIGQSVASLQFGSLAEPAHEPSYHFWALLRNYVGHKEDPHRLSGHRITPTGANQNWQEWLVCCCQSAFLHPLIIKSWLTHERLKRGCPISPNHIRQLRVVGIRALHNYKTSLGNGSNIKPGNALSGVFVKREWLPWHKPRCMPSHFLCDEIARSMVLSVTVNVDLDQNHIQLDI